MGIRIDLKPDSDRIIYEHIDKKIIMSPDDIAIMTLVIDEKKYKKDSCKHDTNIQPSEQTKVDYNTDVNNKSNNRREKDV